MNATSTEVQELIERVREAEQNPGVPMRLAGEDLVVVMSTDSRQSGEIMESWVASSETAYKTHDAMMRAMGQDIVYFANKNVSTQVVVMEGWDGQRIVILYVGGVCDRVYYYEVSRIYVRRDRPAFEKAVPATPRNTRATKKGN